VVRDSRLYLEDILTACRRVQTYVAGMDRRAFGEDTKTIDAVVRNLAIVGEAVKQLGPEVRAQAPEVEWQRIAGLRDILVHAYFGVDLDILWDLVVNKVAELGRQIEVLLEKSG